MKPQLLRCGGGVATLDEPQEVRVLREIRLELTETRAGPVLEPRLRDVVLDPVEPSLTHYGRMIDTNQGIGYGPFGSTSRMAGPNRFQGGARMHDNPPPNEEEQELTKTDRMNEEEEQRSGYAPAEAADGDEEQ
jgi:hypothetical protein